MKNKERSLKNRLVLSLVNEQISVSVFRVIVLICLLPILILCLSFLLLYVKETETRNNDYFESNRQLSVNQIHDLFQDYETQTRLLTQSFNSATKKNELSDSYIRSTLSSILSSHSEIEGVTFQNNKLEQFIETRSSFNNKVYDRSYGHIDPTKRTILIRPLKIQETFGEQQSLIVISRNIYDPNLLKEQLPSKAYVGTIFLFIKPEKIEQILSTNTAYNQLDYFLLYNDRVIYSPERTQRYLNFSKNELLEAYQKKRDHSIKNSFSPSNYLKSFEIITSQHATSSVIWNQPKYWFFILFSLFIATMIPYTIYRLLDKILIQPVETLVTEIGKIQNEMSLIDTSKIPDNEVRFLSRQINQMLVDLYDNNKRLRIAEVKQKESELKSLKSQLQPHYLYNTLEVIRMSALINEDMQVAKMVQHLSNQLEYVLRNTDQELVTVNEEIKNIVDYLELINVRYEGEISYQIDFEEGIKRMQIPRLTLQPLIENSVKHGLKEKSNQGIITVNGYLETDVAVIEIFDNGVGLSEKEITKLNEQLSSPSNHLGLGVVHMRIQHHYGKDYGLKIHSRKNEWTLIRILLPKEGKKVD